MKKLKFWFLLLIGLFAGGYFVFFVFNGFNPSNVIPNEVDCFNAKVIPYQTRRMPTPGAPDTSFVTRTDSVRYRCNEWLLDGSHPTAAASRDSLLKWGFVKAESCPCPSQLELWRYAGPKKVLGIDTGGGEVVVDPKKKGAGVGGLELNYLLTCDTIKTPGNPSTSLNEPSCPTGRVKIAIVDSGVDPTNVALLASNWTPFPSPMPPCTPGVSNTLYGLNIMGSLGNWEPLDDQGHGTHINGIIAGVAPNGGNRMGVPFDILNVKVLDGNNECTLFDALCGLYYALEQNVDVINISWGFKDTIAPTEIFKPFFDAVNSKNVVVVAGLGNDGIDVDGKMKFWPACFANTQPNLISVSALDAPAGTMANFSNWSFSGNYMTVAANGKNIVSSYPRALSLGGTSDLAIMSGTSMATPFVTRTVAVRIGLSKGAGLAPNAAAIKTWIRNNAFQVNDHLVHRKLNHSGKAACPCPGHSGLCPECVDMECPTN
jgi:Subtilase family